MSIRAALLSMTANRCEPVSIPGAGTVYIHAMSELERAHFEAIAQEQKEAKKIKRLLIVMTARESESRADDLIFTGDDVRDMGQMDSAVIDAMATVAMKVCGIGDVDLDDLLKKPASDSPVQTAG